MKTVRRQQEAGIAMVIVMVSVFVLAALAGVFAYSMRVESKLAAYSNDSNDLEWIGRSGIDYARFLLAEQLKDSKQPYDSLDQIWAGGTGDTNDPLSGYSLKDVELDKGKFSVTIVDAERKFNINLAIGNDQVLQKALITVGVDASIVPTIIASIQDWIDPEDDIHVNGAETEFYKGLNPPYVAKKNGPIDDISELLCIKGISSDIYWGPNASKHPWSPAAGAEHMTRSTMLPTMTAPVAGLVDLFTPVSNGKINILTASAAQLQVLPLVDENIANEIVQRRTELGEGAARLPYPNPNELLLNTSLGRQLAPQVAGLCTFRSSYFEVEVVAELGQSKRVCHALLQRNNPKDVKVLSFYWD